jgi:DNA mismatch endonuclease (patch repair protein)
LPGRPDIVLPKHRTIIEVKGCFWHSHRCLKGRAPVGNRAYWEQKLHTNKERDRRNARRLKSLGWRVETIWECEVRGPACARLEGRLVKIMKRAARCDNS